MRVRHDIPRHIEIARVLFCWLLVAAACESDTEGSVGGQISHLHPDDASAIHDTQQPNADIVDQTSHAGVAIDIGIDDYRQVLYHQILQSYPDLQTARDAIPELTAPRIFQVDCPAHIPPGEGTTCHVALVATDRFTESEGTTFISLAVRPGTAPELVVPVAILQGGPGAASTELIGSAPPLSFTQIYVDQRGTGFGSTDFRCSEVRLHMISLLRNTSQENKSWFTDLYGACLHRLVASGAYYVPSTTNHAADVIDVIELLGYEQWGIYGLSYGTTIALEVMQMEPQNLTSAVLDSVYPNGIDLDTHLDYAARSAFLTLAIDFDNACRKLNRCDLVLKDALHDAIVKLNNNPISVELDAEATSLRADLTVYLDGDILAGIVFQLMYDPKAFGLIPKLLRGTLIDDADTHKLIAILQTELQLSVHQSLSHGTYFTIMCLERLPLATGVPHDASVYSEAIIQGGIAELCDAWPLGDYMSSPTSSVTDNSTTEAAQFAVPTLILAGSHDPVTPPYLAESLSNQLTDLQTLVLNGLSHGIWFTDTCITRTVELFFLVPHMEREDQCLQVPNDINWDVYFQSH